MKSFFFIVFIILFSGTLQAQLFRPNVDWHVIQSPHFKVVYHGENDSIAKASATILEFHYKPVQQLTGGSLKNFPVVLNGYNDLSNGYVSPFNFRMEVEIPPIKGKILNPHIGGWLENVLPHELVHAQHFSVVPHFGLSGFIYPFWPDAARSLHFSAQVGFHEGLAVFYESNGLDRLYGRGNHPFFTNQVNSVFAGYGRWSLGQYLQPVNQTLPYNRHYQGGYTFINWVQKHHGEKTSRDIIDFVSRWPFMGFGFAYWYQTGTYPGTSFDLFQKELLANERNRQEKIRSQSVQFGALIETKGEGESLRRPLWVNDSTLLVYGSFYDFKPGFFTVHTQTGALNRISTTGTVEDYRFELNQQKSSLLFARYDIDLIYDETYLSGIYELDLITHKTQSIAVGKRLFNPLRVDDSIWAFQTRGESNVLVDVQTQSVLLNPHQQTLIDFDYSELSKQIAIVVNVNGSQGLWISDKDSIRTILQKKPSILFQNGTIYDPVWHVNGKKLLFTADFSGVMNVFEYDVEKDEIHQLTNSLFNAFEASYSADGNQIAFVVQRDNEQKLATLHRELFLDANISDSLWKHTTLATSRIGFDENFASDSLVSKPYSSGLSWLFPRMFVPGFEQFELGDRFSLALSGTDLLQKHTWFGEYSRQYGSNWYDISYQYTGFWPGFKLRAFKEPLELGLGGNLYAILAETGYSIGIPFKLNLEQNIYHSSFIFEPRLKRTVYSYETATSTLNPSIPSTINQLIDTPVYSLNFNSQLNLNLIQRARDLQPSEGLILYGQADIDLTENSFYELYSDSTISTIFNSSTRKRTAFIAGVYTYLPAFTFRNQSLRLGAKVIHQPHIPVYSLSNFIPFSSVNGFFNTSKTIIELSSRYTFPFFYPENGGFLIPWYVQNIYGVLFSSTHFGSKNVVSRSKPTNTLLGFGIRYTTGLGNLRFDLGVSYIYNTGINKSQFWSGDF